MSCEQCGAPFENAVYVAGHRARADEPEAASGFECPCGAWFERDEADVPEHYDELDFERDDRHEQDHITKDEGVR